MKLSNKVIGYDYISSDKHSEFIHSMLVTIRIQRLFNYYLSNDIHTNKCLSNYTNDSRFRNYKLLFSKRDCGTHLTKINKLPELVKNTEVVAIDNFRKRMYAIYYENNR